MDSKGIGNSETGVLDRPFGIQLSRKKRLYNTRPSRSCCPRADETDFFFKRANGTFGR